MTGLFRIVRALFSSRVRMLEKLGAEIPRIGRANDFQKGPVLKTFSRPLLGDGLLNSEGEPHRERRKLVAPAFAHHRVSKYAETMRAQSEAAVDRWADGTQIDIAQEMMRLTLGIVGRTLFD